MSLQKRFRRHPVTRGVIRTFARGLFGLARSMPLPLARRFARLLGTLGYYLFWQVRVVGYQNLDRAYGDSKNRAEKREILIASAQNACIAVLELVFLPKLHGEFLKKYVRVEGLHEYCDPNKSRLFVSAHFGGWEWLAPVAARHGYRVAEIVRPQLDEKLADMIDGYRRAGGIDTIPRRGAGPVLLRYLREGFSVGVLADQNPRTSAVPTTFFGQSGWSTIAPVMAARRARVPVHLGFLVRDPDDTYTLKISPPVELERTGDVLEDMVVNTQKFQNAIEEMVRAYPGQWMWFHRRWRDRPRLEAEWAVRWERRRARQAASMGEAEDPEQAQQPSGGGPRQPDPTQAA
jgi:Kdo2-lipid IVA lauroyltransferase/acyltransferase